jgi:rhamnosyl/mannosyltransferase
MRILQVGKYYPPCKGGMETVLRHMCEGLLDRGHEVSALVAGSGAEDRWEPLLGPRTGRRGRLLRAGSLGVLNSQPLTPTLPVLLRRELARLRPEIVQLHLPHPVACAACLALLSGGDETRLVVWYHADITRQRLGRRLVQPLVQACLDRADGIATSSTALARQSPLLQRWQSKLQVIPFGIDPREWEPGREAVEGPFLFIGRLVYYKGVSLLLEAIRDLPAAELVIVGDGPLRGELETQARRNGLLGRVRFTGDLPDKELRQEVRRARALVLPSVQPSETFGLVQLEAMAAGLPVISTRLPTGVAEVNLDGVTGRVVPPGEVGALANVLAEVLAHPAQARRWGEAGRRRVRERYTRDTMVTRLESWYAFLVAGDGEAQIVSSAPAYPGDG